MSLKLLVKETSEISEELRKSNKQFLKLTSLSDLSFLVKSDFAGHMWLVAWYNLLGVGDLNDPLLYEGI